MDRPDEFAADSPKSDRLLALQVRISTKKIPSRSLPEGIFCRVRNSNGFVESPPFWRVFLRGENYQQISLFYLVSFIKLNFNYFSVCAGLDIRLKFHCLGNHQDVA